RVNGSRPLDFQLLSRILFAAALAGALACTGSTGLAQRNATMIAIETMTAGNAPADFEFGRTGQGGPPRWLVVDDATAAGGRAIEQASTDRTDYRFPLAIYKAVSTRDVD